MNKRRLLYIVLLLVVIGAGFASVRIPFDPNFDAYALIPDEDREELLDFESSFHARGASSMAIILEKKSGWKSYEDFLLLQQMTDWWQEGDSVVATSLTNVPFPVKKFLGVSQKPFIQLESAERFNRWNKRLPKFRDISSKFLSENSEYTLIFIPSRVYTPHKTDQFQQQFKRHQVSVLPMDYDAIEAELTSTNEKETLFLAAISLFVILGLFYLLTGSLRGLAFIFALIVFSLSLTTIFVALSGMSFSIHMAAIPCMLIVLSFTDLMHLLYAHHSVKEKVASDKELRRHLGNSLHLPMLFTSLTNMFGFALFLLLATNETLRDISVLSIVGVVFAFLTSRYLAIQLLTREQRFFKPETGQKWNRFHESILQKLFKKRYWMLGVTTVISIIFAWSLWHRINIDNIPLVSEGKHPAFKAANVIGDHFFGDKTASVHLEYTNESDFWNDSTMHYLESIEAKVEELFHPLALSSPVLLSKRYHRFQRAGHPGAFSLPVTYDSTFLDNTDMLGGVDVYSRRHKRARIRFSFKDMKLQPSLKRFAELEEFLASNPPPKGLKVQLNGSALHNDRATQVFSKNILIGILISVLFGAIAIFFVVKNGLIFLVALVANFLPLLSSLLVMEFTGNELNPISLFFFTVIMGLCVDDSIYLLLHKDAKHKTSLYPIAITSAVLTVGFATFLFSEYDWVRPFGWIFIAGIAIAFVFDAFLLALFTERNRTFGDDG